MPNNALHPTRARKLFHVFEVRAGHGWVGFRVRLVNWHNNNLRED
jgi:hypothetical protein